MKLGDTANDDAAAYPKPLAGVRVLAAEQMQALPFATQLLSRLGAEVVKVEHPTGGDSGRGSLPAMVDPEGRNVGATFLRNNFNKRSITLDIKSPEGKQIFLDLATKFDVIAENFKPGTMDRMGLGYADIAGVNPGAIYLSISGFGNPVFEDMEPSPYGSWPAYASIVEAMSGIYEFKREEGRPPVTVPAGALGDIGSAMFGVIGVLAALRQRDLTGEGQYVDVAMLDAMVAMTDLVTNFWSMGMRPDGLGALLIMDGFEASDGWFIIQVGREHHFALLAETIGHPEWLTDERLATRKGWRVHLDDVIRPDIEGWAADKTQAQVCEILGVAGIAAGPSLSAPQVIADPHVAARNMLIEMERTDDIAEPILVPGNPVKLSKMVDGGDTRVPWHGEHTRQVLAEELGLSDSDLDALDAKGVF